MNVAGSSTVVAARCRRTLLAAVAAVAALLLGAGLLGLDTARAQEPEEAAPGFHGDPATSARIDQADPVVAAVAVSQERFPDMTAAHVVLSRTDDVADSFAGTGLTGDGPLLYTETGQIAPVTLDEVKRVLPDGGRVYLLGGEAAISSEVAERLATDGLDVARLAGATRVETAVAVADEVRALYPGTEVLLARAFGVDGDPTSAWVDAVAAGGVAAAGNTPVLITPSGSLAPAVAAWLDRDDPSRTVLLGGEAALSTEVADAVPGALRVSGAERNATAAAIARQLTGASDTGPRRAVVINGARPDGWMFGLAAGGIAGDAGAPVLLVSGSEVAQATRALVSTCGDPEVDVLAMGSGRVITTAALRQLDALDGLACDRTPEGAARLASALAPFDDCDQLLGYFRDSALDEVTPYGLGYDYLGGPEAGVPVNDGEDSGAGTPPQPAASEEAPQEGRAEDVSGTNVQEEGVDEPDLVKTDGRVALTVAQGSLQVVDLTGDEPRLTATLALDGDDEFEDYGYAGELLLEGDRALVLSQEFRPVESSSNVYALAPPVTTLTAVDVSDPSAPAVEGTVALDGGYRSARMVDGVVRVVSDAGPHDLPFVFPDYPQDRQPTEDEAAEAEAEALAENRRVISESTLEQWLPTYTVADASGEEGPRLPLVDCADVQSPLEFAGLGTLSVTTLDLRDGVEPTSAATIVAAGETVYASATTLYVATSRWTAFAQMLTADQGITTDIHAFDIGAADDTRYRGSGRVEGYLLNQFSMSEHEGHLRVATTTGPPWGDGTDSESGVVVLRLDDDGFTEVGQVGGLGRGEQIFAVRFLGDLAAVVTFVQVDPLYTIDLADPSEPRVLGELKVPGFSRYLHRVGEDLLLGVGQDADADGFQTGGQVSLFDISDRSNPRQVDQVKFGQGGSEIEHDHRAFLYWEPAGLAVLPFAEYGEQGTSSGAIGVDVDPTGLDEAGRLEHPGGSGSFEETDYLATIRRTFVVGDTLYSVSEKGLGAHDLDTLANQSFVTFPRDTDDSPPPGSQPEPEPEAPPPPPTESDPVN